MKYTSLHVHSTFSVLDGHLKLDDYIERTQELGHTHLALTDHGTLAGLPEFWKQAKHAGLNPIAGIEAYHTIHHRSDKIRDSNHLTLLAWNRTGYHNLIKLASLAHLEGMYFRPRVDRELLNRYRDGVICLSGCFSGALPRAILHDDEPLQARLLDEFQSIFGEHFYLEFMNHGHHLPEQMIVNKKLAEHARKYGIKTVATNDSHFCRFADGPKQRWLLAGKGGQIGSSPHDYLRSDADMVRAFGDNNLLKNSLRIARMTETYDLGDPTPKLPIAPLEGDDPVQSLRRLAWQGLLQRLAATRPGEVPFDYEIRLDYELDVLQQMGRQIGVPFERYLLVVADLTRFARARQIRFGPRGSAAGSLICWALGISELDPLTYQLSFERFLNPERVSLPDIDLDVADNKRSELLGYLQQTYGQDRVAQIATYNMIGPKAALRDAAKLLRDELGEPYQLVQAKLAKTVPYSQHRQTLQSVLDEPGSLLAAQQTTYGKVIDVALALDGRGKSTSTHAAGILVADRPLIDFVPVMPGKDLPYQSQYDGELLADIGALKLDVLGLGEWAKMQRCFELIEQSGQTPPDLWSLAYDDPEVWKLINDGAVLGLFQLSGPGMVGAIGRLQPQTLLDLALLNAIWRPGPMANLGQIAEVKHGQKPYEPIHPDLDEILRPVYGVPVFQEDIIAIVQKFSGCRPGEADLVRKAIGKKNVEGLEREHQTFLERSQHNGYAKEEAERIWSFIEPFAGYGFNRAHAFTYAAIGYHGAYLKHYYPQAFYAAQLEIESRSGNKQSETSQNRIGALIMEARSRGIQLLPPDIRHPVARFTPDGTNGIRYGLEAVKDIGDKAAQVLEKNGPYANLTDLVLRSPHPVNAKTFQVLAKIGALPWHTRTTSEVAIKALCDLKSRFGNPAPRKGESKQAARARGKARVEADAAALVIQTEPERPVQVMLSDELNHLGFTHSPWPHLPHYAHHRISDCGRWLGTNQRLSGMVSIVQEIITKHGTTMAKGVLLDETNQIDFLIWPSSWQSFRAWLAPGACVHCVGEVELKMDQFSHDLQDEMDGGEAPPPGVLTLKIGWIGPAEWEDA